MRSPCCCWMLEAQSLWNTASITLSAVHQANGARAEAIYMHHAAGLVAVIVAIILLIAADGVPSKSSAFIVLEKKGLRPCDRKHTWYIQ